MQLFFRTFLLILTLINITSFKTYASSNKMDFVIISNVNGDIISNFDVQQRQNIIQIFKINLSTEPFEIKKLLIEEILQKQFSNSRGYKLTDEEISKNLEEFLKTQKLTKISLINLLKDKEIEWSSFDNFLNSTALWKKSLIKNFGGKAMLREADLNLPPEKHLTRTILGFDLSEIIIPFAEYGKPKSLLLANRLKLELNAGGNFGDAARRFSRSQSQMVGGKLGFIDERKLPKELKEILSELSDTQIAGPITTKETVILFKLNKREKRQLKSNLDYLMEFIIVEEEKANGIKSCNEAPSDIKESVLLSKLEAKQSKILRIAKKFEVNRLSDTEVIILCNSKIQGTTTQINNKKAKYFNDQMIAFSEMLMLKLYREAIIK